MMDEQEKNASASSGISSADASVSSPAPDSMPPPNIIAPMAFDGPLFAGPIKRSITISRHQTSISLEPVFWAALRHVAEQENIPVSTLVARIDEERISHIGHAAEENYVLANLASAIRCWLWAHYFTPEKQA